MNRKQELMLSSSRQKADREMQQDSALETKKIAIETEQRPTLPGPMRAYVADERKMIDKSRELSLSDGDGEAHKSVVTHDLYNDGKFYQHKDVAAKPENQPKRHAPEVGKTYKGPIVSVDDRHVIQTVREGRRELHIRHERKTLSSSQRDLFKQGANVEIRYPYEHVGIAKAWQEREHSSPASRGIEPRGRV